jgi:ubiquinone/menaquinone biosynthesis C-methylase UbiE
MTCLDLPVAAAAAFDSIAGSYDDTFTRSVVGRAQRQAVWEILTRVFKAGDRILELNCGTGEDALFLGRRGVAVEACDASAEMIEVAQRKKKIQKGPQLTIQFRQLATEEIETLDPWFDGALSNFSGLNCVQDLRRVASDLSTLVRGGGNVVLVVSSRCCLWEFVWFSAHGDFRKARRRLDGHTIGKLGQYSVRIWYPTKGEIEAAFSPWFRLCSTKAVGLLVPPSYLESWASKHTRLISALAVLDRIFGGWSVLRSVGDHLLLHLERVQP